jgi:hypothetical protein
MEQARAKLFTVLHDISTLPYPYFKENLYQDLCPQLIQVALDIGAGQMTERIQAFLTEWKTVQDYDRMRREEGLIQDFIIEFMFHPTDLPKKREWLRMIANQLMMPQETDEDLARILQYIECDDVTELMSPFWKRTYPGRH